MEAQRISADKGIDLLIYCTLRSPEEQARLYRQSRSRAQINRKVDWHRRHGLDVLADILIKVGPQAGILGRHVTMAGPGESWHNYGRAFDAVPVIGGKAMWSTSHPHWAEYGTIIRDLQLEWAGDWPRFREFPHAQLPAEGSPLKVLTVEEVVKLLGGF
jgi:peptidoglycan L-alanyl-D-glutamate endopeptidase CwlK